MTTATVMTITTTRAWIRIRMVITMMTHIHNAIMMNIAILTNS